MDVGRFRADGTALPTSTERKRFPRPKRGEWFVKGPIPGRWIARAAKLPGKTLHVAIALWHVAEIEKNCRVRFSRKWRERFGVGPDATRRALAALEVAGLVAVESHMGRAPIVTILDPAAATPHDMDT